MLLSTAFLLTPVNLVGSADAVKVSPAARMDSATVSSCTVVSVLPVRVNPQKITAAIATESIQAAILTAGIVSTKLRTFFLKFCIKFSFVLICKNLLHECAATLCILATLLPLYSSPCKVSRKSPL